MAALPGYVGVLYDSIRDRPNPSVERTEMERGVAKQRRTNTGTLISLPLTFDFATMDDAEAFLDWYFDVIRIVDFFDMTHPRTGATIRARFVGGDVGELRPAEGIDRPWQRDVQVEYLR